MRVTVFSARAYDRQFLDHANSGRYDLRYFETHLSKDTIGLCEAAGAICVFVNDDLSAPVINRLATRGVKLVVLRSAGYNHVDLAAADACGIAVGRVPAYSPNAVAEHTVALILSLNRKIHRAFNRVREGNFSLDGLLGFDLAGKTVGIVGLGNIGACVARIMTGFGCRVLAHDPTPSAPHHASMATMRELLEQSDIVTLHCPLNASTRHLIDDEAISLTKRGVHLVNTSRGAVIDTRAAIRALKSGHLGGLALDVYEEEEHLFFHDHSDSGISDDVFARLLTFPNVLITGHQAFFTHEALTAIAETTIDNLAAFEATGRAKYPVVAQSS